MAVKLFQTSTFRLAFGYTALFVLAALALFGIIYFNTTALLVRQTDETIAAEIQGLSEHYAASGIAGLVGTVQGRSRRPGDGLYFVGDTQGRYLVGNLDSLPEAAPSKEGWIDFQITRTEIAGPADNRFVRQAARARVFALPEGAVLLVERNIQARLDIEAVIERALIWGLAATLILGVVGGVLAGRRMLRRVDAAGLVAREIITGDLSRRLPLAGSGDELDRLSITLNEMLTRIERLMAGLREVTDNIAHDLRTPLTRIRAQAESAAGAASTDAGAKAALGKVIGEADRMLAMISALLSIARLEAGSGREEFVATDLSALLADLAELYEPAAKDAGFKFSADVAPQITVTADRQLLGQAVTNLIENALKYGRGENTPSMTLELARQDDSVAIVVADRGPGIPAGKRDAVFDRFARLDALRAEPGAGLGLSLARAIAEAHGGTITLEDNKPGLCAVLSLPVTWT